MLPKPDESHLVFWPNPQTFYLYIFKVLSVSLRITEGKDELDPVKRQANVTILLNDEAHGVIEFNQDSYTVHESDHNTTVHIPIARKRGTHGDLKVYYRYLYCKKILTGFIIKRA